MVNYKDHSVFPDDNRVVSVPLFYYLSLHVLNLYGIKNVVPLLHIYKIFQVVKSNNPI